MSPSDRPDFQKVTLEDLLRLKRAEQPAPEFWTRFEQELRAKQLAAIIEKRPWWSTLSAAQLLRQAGRFRIPVGAAAALALSIVTVREYRSDTSAPAHSAPVPSIALASAAPPPITPSRIEAPVVASAPTETIEPAPALVETTMIVAVATPEVSAVEAEAIETTEASAAVVVATATTTVHEPRPAPLPPGGLMAMIPWAGAPAPEHNPSSSTFEVGELPHVHFASAAFPGREHDFAGRVEVEPVVLFAPAATPASSPATVVAQTPSRDGLSPSELRRQRILAGIAVADSVSEAERSRLSQVRELIGGALDEERLYDNVRRLGMGGDRLTLKF